MRPGVILPLLILISVLEGCVGSRDVEVPPDEQFGHRFESEGPEGRRTFEITPADSSVSYFYYPAAVDTVHIRPAPFESQEVQSDTVPVEVLVKGALPDACSELHDVTQERYGHILEMRIVTRRPQGAVCASVLRPFRFYLRLDGLYGPGSYTLKLNNRAYTFSVRAPEAG